MHIRNPIEWIFGTLQSNPGVGTAKPADYWPENKLGAGPRVNRITRAELGEALRRGWHDFAAARTDLLMFLLIYPVLALFVAAADRWGTLLPLLFPTASGFALVGPLFAVGLYEMSRQRELTGKISWLDSFAVLRSPAIGAITMMGLVLIVLFLAWLAVAFGVFELTMGPGTSLTVAGFTAAVLTTTPGWAMVVLGVAAGAFFAVAVLALSVVSFPLLLDRPATVRVAMATSIAAVRENPGPLAMWGLVVAGGLVLGSLPCFIGLIVVLPVLGHATWHLYRALVRK